MLESRSIDALGFATKQRSDGAGRTMRSLDQLDNATSFAYDAGGNQLSVRDPNNVGADMVYDALGRNTQRTDTFGDVTKSEYDRAGNAIKQIDAKNKNTLIAFDARGRRKSTTDRIGAVTTFAYTALGQLLSLTRNKTSESITGVMSGYGFTAAGTTYDNEDRLTGFARAATSGPALLSQSWNLNAVGDWTSVTANGTAQGRTHGPAHELLTADGQTVATDVKGNITTLPANLRPAGATTSMNLNWDFDNKLRSADIDASGTADVNFQYDALARRVARTGAGYSVVYVQMDQQTIADYPVGGAATTPTFRYVYASYSFHRQKSLVKVAGTFGDRSSGVTP